MFTTWITSGQSADRLDAMFYAPIYRATANKVESVSCGKTFEDIRGNNRPIVYGVLKPEPCKSGFPMVRNLDFSPPGIAVNQVLRIPQSQNTKFKRSQLNPGDLLVTIGGYVGTAAIVPSALAGGNINQHIARVSVDATKADAYFLWAYIECHYGRRLMERWVSGTAQPGVNIGDLRRINVPYPDLAIQRAIGNKVRKAERLRELAVYWKQAAHAKMDDQSVKYEREPAQSNWIAVDDLNSRLDTQPYRTHFLSLQKELQYSSAVPLANLAVVSGGDPVSSDEFDSKGVPLVRIRDIQPTGFAAPDVHVSKSYFSSKPQCVARPGRIVMGMDGEFRAQFFIESDLPRFINQRVAIIDCNTIRPELLTAWLNRVEGQLQLARWAVQTTVAHTSLNDIRNLLIPRLAHYEEEWLADAFIRTRKADAEAVLLINTARTAVEALIDGTLNESALLAEGEAIEKWLAENPSPHKTEVA